MNRLLFRGSSLLAAVLGVCSVPQAAAQRATVQFEADTFALGKPVLLRMEITHPSEMTVIFPHQSAAFAPFELVGTEATPTRTSGGQSVDVAHYRVSSFELGAEQRVSLVWKYLDEKGDTIPQLAVSQPIKLRYRVSEGETSLRRQSSAITLHDDPDYFIIGVIITVFILAMVAGLLMLRRPVSRYIRQRGIRQEWKAIRAQLNRIAQQQSKPSVFLDELNILWKEYLNFGTRQPLRSFTTRELQPLLQKQASLTAQQRQTLLQLSQTADNVIYAGTNAPNPIELTRFHTEITGLLRAAYLQKKAAIQ